MTQHQAASDQLDLGRIASTIAARWYIVVACTVLVGAGAVGYSKGIANPVFESTALVSYTESSREGNPTGGALPSTGITRENIQALIPFAQRTDVAEVAARKVDISTQDLRLAVQVRPHGDAPIIDFVARANSAEKAADYANAYAQAFVKDRRDRAADAIDALIEVKEKELAAFPARLKPEDTRVVRRSEVEAQLGDLRSERVAWLSSIDASQARPPIDSVWPRTKLMLLVALLVGFGLGCGVALLRARTDRRLHGDEWDELPAPVLVRVPHARSAPRNAPLGPTRADPQIADAFAALGARILLDRTGEGALVVMVSSARSGEGKSSVAANLASALAAGGRRVVLVDADMRRPTQDQMFPMLVDRPGLSQLLLSTAAVEQALTLVASNLAAIGSGPRQSNASTLLSSVSFRTLVERLRGICEVVVVDTPPVLAVTDALTIASHSDHVLLCARIGASRTEEVEVAHDRIEGAARVSQSVVLVGTERPSGYGYDTDDLWPADGKASAPSSAAGGRGAVA